MRPEVGQMDRRRGGRLNVTMQLQKSSPNEDGRIAQWPFLAEPPIIEAEFTLLAKPSKGFGTLSRGL